MSKQDDGPIWQIIEIGTNAPLIGLALAAVFGSAAAGFQWVYPKSVHGLAPAVAMIFWVMAVTALFSAAYGFVRQQFNRHRRGRRLIAQRTLADLCDLSPTEFEEVVADLFRRQGHRVSEVGGPSDGGIDLLLHRNDPAAPEHFVQCKRYRNRTVGVAELREFYGAMAAHQTRCEGIVVTTGRFTPDAMAFAAGKPIRLIAGAELLQMLASANPVTSAVRAYTTPAPATPIPAAASTPACPACRVPMVRRVASKGQFAGKPFWGCRNFPRCREIVSWAPET